MLQFIRNKLPNNYHVFYSVYDAVLAFLPNNFVTEISTENNPSIKSISNFIEENKIDVIYITPIMLKNSVFLSNPIVEKEWNLFLVNPNTLGFTKTIIENSDAYLLTKNIK
jgi:hypothetical protein